MPKTDRLLAKVRFRTKIVDRHLLFPGSQLAKSGIFWGNLVNFPRSENMIMTTTNVLTTLAHPIPGLRDKLRKKMCYIEIDFKKIFIEIINLFFK